MGAVFLLFTRGSGAYNHGDGGYTAANAYETYDNPEPARTAETSVAPAQTAEQRNASYNSDNARAAVLAYINKEIAAHESQIQHWLDVVNDDFQLLNRPLEIHRIFMNVAPPSNFDLLGTFAEDVVGFVVSEALSLITGIKASKAEDVIKYATSLFFPPDIPQGMIYTIEVFAKAELEYLQELFSEGITEENLREIYHSAHAVLAYQYSLMISFYLHEIQDDLWEFSRLVGWARTALREIERARAQINTLKAARDHLPDYPINQAAAKLAFTNMYESFDHRLPRAFDINALPFEVNSAIILMGEDTQYNKFLRLDPLRVMQLENRTNRASSVANIVGKFIPVFGGAASGAFSAMNSRQRSNTYMSIVLPNLFYLENVVKQQNNLHFDISHINEHQRLPSQIMQNIDELCDIYTQIMYALVAADFMYVHIESQLRGPIAREKAKQAYMMQMASRLFNIVLSNDAANVNHGFVFNERNRWMVKHQGLQQTAGITMHLLWSHGLMLTYDAEMVPPLWPADAGVDARWLKYSPDYRFSSDRDINSAFVARMTDIRNQYVMTSMLIINFAMDTNFFVDGTAQRGTANLHRGPIDARTNRIRYDRMQTLCGNHRILKFIETHQMNTSSAMYTVYFNTLGHPIHIAHRNGNTINAMYTLMGWSETYRWVRGNSQTVGGECSDIVAALNYYYIIMRDIVHEIGTQSGATITNRIQQARDNHAS